MLLIITHIVGLYFPWVRVIPHRLSFGLFGRVDGELGIVTADALETLFKLPASAVTGSSPPPSTPGSAGAGRRGPDPVLSGHLTTVSRTWLGLRSDGMPEYSHTECNAPWLRSSRIPLRYLQATLAI